MMLIFFHISTFILHAINFGSYMHHGIQIIGDWIVSTPKIAVYITDNFEIFMLQVVIIINDVLRFDLISILLKGETAFIEPQLL